MQPIEHLNRELHVKLIDGLYVEAMVLADEARSYFGVRGDEDREALDPIARVSFSCESLKVTTRLMHVIAWLLCQRAWLSGEIDAHAYHDPKYRLGEATGTEPEALVGFPNMARGLIAESEELYERVQRLETSMMPDLAYIDGPNPALALIQRLESAF